MKLESRSDFFDRDLSLTCCETNRLRVSEMREMTQRSLCEVSSIYSEVARVFQQKSMSTVLLLLMRPARPMTSNPERDQQDPLNQSTALSDSLSGLAKRAKLL